MVKLSPSTDTIHRTLLFSDWCEIHSLFPLFKNEGISVCGLMLPALALWNMPFDLPLGDFETRMTLYIFMTFVLGIILGGTMRGMARVILGLTLLSGFAVLVLLLLKRQDILSLIVSGIFGLIMMVFSILSKLGKTYVPRG